MVDYTKLAATAERLITENGREITFVRKNQTPLDANKPWNGPNATETTLALYAVFAPPNTVRQFGLTALGDGTEFMDLLSFSEKIAIVYPSTNDLRQYKIIRDGGIDWNMIGLQVLEPGPTKVLAFVGVRR